MTVKDSFSKKIKAYLKTNHDDLTFVFTKIKILEDLNKNIIPLLESNLQNYCQVANLKGDQLILLVANGSIATQIRFSSVDLLRKFKLYPALSQIKSIHCKVRPPQRKIPLEDPQKANLLSTETANIVSQIAETFSDPRLREIMQKIAKNTNKTKV